MLKPSPEEETSLLHTLFGWWCIRDTTGFVPSLTFLDTVVFSYAQRGHWELKGEWVVKDRSRNKGPVSSTEDLKRGRSSMEGERRALVSGGDQWQSTGWRGLVLVPTGCLHHCTCETPDFLSQKHSNRWLLEMCRSTQMIVTHPLPASQKAVWSFAETNYIVFMYVKSTLWYEETRTWENYSVMLF